MNFKRFGSLLSDNPLCGISAYKDTLNLATGVCTRQIKKLVLTGEEPWGKSGDGIYSYFGLRLGDSSTTFTTAVCTHYENVDVTKTSPAVGFMLTASSRNLRIRTNDVENVSLNDFVSFLTQQYANGTPVTVWYVLDTPTTETITVPSGLSGAEEGYLNQSGTPTPTNPIYPTANEVKVWADTPHYIHKTDADILTTLPADIYVNDTTATVGLKGNMEQSGTPTPDNPIMPEGCGDLETVGAKAGQYKIPITSAGQTTPIYLGEVETTRQIRKLVLTGDNSETYIYNSQYSRFTMTVSDAYSVGTRKTQCYCSHYNCVYHEEIIDDVPNNSIYINYQVAGTQFCIKTTSYTTIEDFKSYLAQQYAAGTPVVVWYVLANEETGIVNEPLMKIGEYADTVSGITIPTITGKDTFDVETTLKPSEVSLSYTGWHDATVEEWDGSQWNE